MSVEHPPPPPACDAGDELRPNQRRRERSRSRDRVPSECERHTRPKNRRDTFAGGSSSTLCCTCVCERCRIKRTNCLYCSCGDELDRDYSLRFPGMTSKQEFDELMRYMDESVYEDEPLKTNATSTHSHPLLDQSVSYTEATDSEDVEYFPGSDDDQRRGSHHSADLAPSGMDTDGWTDESSDDSRESHGANHSQNVDNVEFAAECPEGGSSANVDSANLAYRE